MAWLNRLMADLAKASLFAETLTAIDLLVGQPAEFRSPTRVVWHTPPVYGRGEEHV